MGKGIWKPVSLDAGSSKDDRPHSEHNRTLIISRCHYVLSPPTLSIHPPRTASIVTTPLMHFAAAHIAHHCHLPTSQYAAMTWWTSWGFGGGRTVTILFVPHSSHLNKCDQMKSISNITFVPFCFLLSFFVPVFMSAARVPHNRISGVTANTEDVRQTRWAAFSFCKENAHHFLYLPCYIIWVWKGLAWLHIHRSNSWSMT